MTQTRVSLGRLLARLVYAAPDDCLGSFVLLLEAGADSSLVDSFLAAFKTLEVAGIKDFTPLYTQQEIVNMIIGEWDERIQRRATNRRA